ncbi:Ankyrin repeat domain-containing protein 55, partial [Rhizoclosmatium sp. JEL0117]
AVLKGHADIVHLLLKSHASPNAQDLIGCTACHYAIYLGDVSCFRLLMDSGASTAIIDKTGLTLLHHAVHKSRSEMSLQLLQTFPPAWVNSQYTGADGNQTTLLHAAATKSLNKVVKALIELGADLDAKDSRNRTPLECIDYENYEPEIVELLTSDKLEVKRSAEGFLLNKMEVPTDNIVDTSVTTLVLETTASKSLGEINAPANSAETQSSVEESKLKALRDEVERLQSQLIIAVTARAEADIRTSNALEQLESLRREYAISNRKRAADVPIQTVVKPVSGRQNDSSSQIVNLETSARKKSDEIKQLRSSLINERTLNEKLKEEVERLGKELSFVKGTNSSLEILLANERDMTRQLKATMSSTEFKWKDINKKLDRLYSVLILHSKEETTGHTFGPNDTIDSISPDILKLSLSSRPNIDSIHALAAAKDYDGILAFLQNHPNAIDAIDQNGRTALCISVFVGAADVVHLLLKCDANPDIVDCLGCAPIHYAVWRGDISCFRLLVDKEANVGIIDKSGLPLLYHAIKLNRPVMAQYLIQSTSKELLNKHYGESKSTALHLAVANSMTSIIHLLISKGADPTPLDADNRKPIECIDYDNYGPEIEAIVEYLASLELAKSGSIISFADSNSTCNAKVSKSVLDLISKSAASLVAKSLASVAASENASTRGLVDIDEKKIDELNLTEEKHRPLLERRGAVSLNGSLLFLDTSHTGPSSANPIQPVEDSSDRKTVSLNASLLLLTPSPDQPTHPESSTQSTQLTDSATSFQGSSCTSFTFDSKSIHDSLAPSQTSLTLDTTSSTSLVSPETANPFSLKDFIALRRQVQSLTSQLDAAKMIQKDLEFTIEQHAFYRAKLQSECEAKDVLLKKAKQEIEVLKEFRKLRGEEVL